MRLLRKSCTRLNDGFTLIELLTVIVIIGILASLTFLSYSSADKQVRDAQRKNDIEQYRNLLQQYAIAHSGVYPQSLSTSQPEVIGSSNLCAQSQLSMTPCLTDPLANSNPFNDGTQQSKLLNYQYISDGATYILFARMEASSDKYWEACSTGKSGVVSAIYIPPTDSSSGSCGIQ